MNFTKICNDVLKSNPKIRFTGVLNSKGDLVANKNRSNSPLLTDNEVKMAIHYTFDRWTNLQNLEFKLGKEKESITNYENVTTISMDMGRDLFLLSLEPNSNYKKIISDTRKILESSLKNKPDVKKSKIKTKKTPTKKKESKKPKLTKAKKPQKPSKTSTNEIRSRLEELEKRMDKISTQI
ncbi:MAG: hypothetical protein PVI88_01980 [Nitrosopumilaceae archaeon]|jgi:hypothetical protein